MSSAVFFDIGGTLGAPRLSAPPIRLTELDIYPYVESVLADVSDAGARLGIISNTGRESFDDMRRVLETTGIYTFFETDLLLYSSVVGLQKDSPEIFKFAARKAGLVGSPSSCLFVGKDSRERSFASEAGWKVCPHPMLVKDVLAGESLHYVKITAPVHAQEQTWRKVLRKLSVVPLHTGGTSGNMVYAIVAHRVTASLANALFDVQLLGSPNDPLGTDFFFLRDDLAANTGFLTESGPSAAFLECDEQTHWLLGSTEEGLLVALPSDRSVEEFHFEHAHHGHNLKLTPDPSLLEPFGTFLSLLVELRWRMQYANSYPFTL